MGRYGQNRVSIPYLTGRPLQRHCELGRPSSASPKKPLVVVLSSGPNSEGGGQPPPSEGRFEVDHPTGALHPWNLISDRLRKPAISNPKPKNFYPRRGRISLRPMCKCGLGELEPTL